MEGMTPEAGSSRLSKKEGVPTHIVLEVSSSSLASACVVCFTHKCDPLSFLIP